MAVKNTGGGGQNDISVFIEKLHDIRMEERKARAKRLEGNQVGKAISNKAPAKQIGYSFKSGQHEAINNNAAKYDYSSMGGNGSSGKTIKTGKNKK